MGEPQQHPIDQLAEAFLERYRRGENPSLEDFIAEHPEDQTEIRNLFPALVVLERLAPSGPAPLHRLAAAPPEQLGDYRILREIGRGGMGVVYEAEHQPLGRQVALKVLPSFAAEKPSVVKRFLREAKAAGLLHHTNIVPVFDVGHCDGLHYYAMQFIEGQSLAAVISQLRVLKVNLNRADSKAPPTEWDSPASATEAAIALLRGETHSLESESVKASSPDSGTKTDRTSAGDSTLASHSDLSGSRPGEARYWRNVARIGVQLARALQFAHDQGVIHRDIKPSNILLDLSGTAWITDFGLAHTGSHDLTAAGTVLGTLRFMAPEQLRGWSDPRTDVYGLGLTLYELLTLRAAFATEERAELLKQICERDPPKPRQIDRSIPPDLETIVLKAIEKEPSRRYQTAGELSDDLARFLDVKPIRAKQTSTIGHVSRWCRRNPQVAGLAATLALLLILMAVGGWTAAGWLATQAANLRQRAAELSAEKQTALERLFDASLNEARAARNSSGPGRRVNTLAAVRRAADVLSQVSHSPEQLPELRNLATAALSFTDATPETRIDIRGAHYVSFTPDLSLIACVMSPSQVLIRRVKDGEELICLKSPEKPAARAEFSPNGQYLVVGYANTYAGERNSMIWVWDWQQARVLVETAGYHYGVSFTPDSTAIAIPQLKDSVEVYDLPSGEKRYQIRTDGDTPYPQFRPRHSTLAVSSRASTVVQCFNAMTGKAEGDFRLPQTTDGTRWSPDGRYVAYSLGNDVALWDANTRRHAGTLLGHRSTAWPQEFSPDSRAVMTLSWDERTILWDVASCQPLVAVPGKARHWSRDGSRFAVLESGRQAVIYRAIFSDDFHQFRSPQQYPTLAVAPDEQLLALAGDTGVCLVDAQQHAVLQERESGESRSAAFHPGGQCLVTTSPQGLLRWDLVSSTDGSSRRLADPQPLAATKVHSAYQRLSFDSGGNRLAYNAADHEVRIVSWNDPSQLVQFHLETDLPHIENIALSPDGRWMAAITAGPLVRLRVWDVESAAVVHNLHGNGGYSSVLFNPSSQRLIVRFGTEYVVLEAGTWRELHRIERDPTTCWAMAFSLDGRTVALSMSNQVFRLYDARTFEPLLTLEPPTVQDHTACGFSADGTKFYTASQTGYISCWDLAAIRRQLDELGLDWD